MSGLRVVDRFDREVEVVIDGDDLSAQDLAEALEPATHSAMVSLRRGVIVDGRWHPPATPIDQLVLRQGSLVHPSPTPPVAPAESTARVLLSADDRIRVGESPLTIREGLGMTDGVVPFNRPPRLDPAVDPAAISVPAEPPERPPAEPLSIAGIVLPIVGGAVIALLLSPMLAVFAALGPVVTIGMWWERRHRAEREYRRAKTRERDAVGALRARLPLLVAAEVLRRRSLVPAMTTCVERATCVSSRLWERGAADADALLLGIGTTTTRFQPRLQVEGEGSALTPSALAVDAIEAVDDLVDVPLTVSLAPGRIVGFVGPRASAQAASRALAVQLVAHQGPSVVRLVVATSTEMVDAWGWCRWLPHCADPSDGEAGALIGLTGHIDIADRATFGLVAGSAPTIVAILDDPAAFHGRRTVGRRLVDHEGVAMIVIAPSVDRLPAGCTDLLQLDGSGGITRRDPRIAGGTTTGRAWDLSHSQALAAARCLAQLDDPALDRRDVGIPNTVPLLHPLGLTGDDPAEVNSRWASSAGQDALIAVLGADAHGPVDLDLIADGPHVLVGGTTGSGKSELLRSLIAGLAASHDPDHCAFVLIDYKGGAAFDCCRDLPHVAGFVTDLDQSLAARALRCLEAELRYREGRLRELGAQDIGAYRTLGSPGEALPRLLVVIDEFATLASELPDFLDALVGIAQRGRSLGVHLVLATQRPAGVVTDDIRANAGCRVALRVTDTHDSFDVIGAPDAAAIPRSRPGRAVARLGPSELVTFQSAIVTGKQAQRPPLDIRFHGDDAVASEEAECGQSDLERLVDTISEAWGDQPRPRAPWPDALPDTIERAGAGWFLVDDPDAQHQRVEGWSSPDGHLVVVSGPGGGATTTLAEAVLVAIESGGHAYVIDLDAGELGELDTHPSVGAVIGPTDSERRRRLLRRLDDEVTDRRARGSAQVPILLVIDDLGGLERAHDPIREVVVHEQLERIWADGPAVGVVVAVSIRRAAELPTSMAATAGLVLLHATSDTADALRFGLSAVDTTMPPGRARRASDGALLHVMRTSTTVKAGAAARLGTPAEKAPFEVGTLATAIDAIEVGASVAVGATSTLRIAVAERDLRLITLVLHPGEHALVLGPARSGRTTTLETIGRLASSVLVVGSDPELADRLDVGLVSPGDLEAALVDHGPTLVLIDHCLSVDDPSGHLARLVAAPPEGVHVIASAQTARMRRAYGHWSSELSASRAGILLQPDPLDGDLLGAPLPGRLSRIAAGGRGFVVADGEARLVQLVRHGGAQTRSPP